jgi:hypothetical protein
LLHPALPSLLHAMVHAIVLTGRSVELHGLPSSQSVPSLTRPDPGRSRTQVPVLAHPGRPAQVLAQQSGTGAQRWGTHGL